MIAELLTEGKENARPGREICDMLNISSRDLMAAVERERREGAAICASSGANPGYYLAADKREMQDYCRFLFRRGSETMKTYRACKETAEKMPEVIEHEAIV